MSKSICVFCDSPFARKTHNQISCDSCRRIEKSVHFEKKTTITELVYTATLPIKTISEANCSQHWATKYKRHREQQFVVKSLHLPKLPLPCHIVLTRFGKKILDDDNLPSALKWVRDAVADKIFPNLPPGCADASNRLSWQYKQEVSPTYYVTMEIYAYQSQ